MTPHDDSDCQKICSVDLQRMLIVAYTRLFLLPERTDGSKLTTIGSVGPYDVRLTELPSGIPTSAIPPLWVELYDAWSGRILDSAGCRDLQEAGPVTEAFIGEAQRRMRLT
jgi:hypothetical protein